MSIKPVVLAAALGLVAAPASAAMMAPDAQMHFKAVASGDVSNIMSQYAPGATVSWIGGPLDGAYTGHAAIRSLWGKFAHANGKMSEKAHDIVVASDPMGMTVTANVEFMGKTKIPVRYVLVYRKGKIASEVWQIAPKLPMG